MRNIEYSLCLADPDLWFKEETCPSEGAKYCSYFLLYVDECLVFHHAADTIMHELDDFLKIKSGSIGYPNMYLEPKSRMLYCKTELKHGLLVHQSMCRMLCLIQRFICMRILWVGSLQRTLLLHLSRSMIH